MLLHLRCPIQRMLGLLRDLKELGHLPHQRAPRKQYRRGEECVHLVWHHILYATYWSFLGRHVLGEVQDFSGFPLSLHRRDACPDGFDDTPVDDAILQPR